MKHWFAHDLLWVKSKEGLLGKRDQWVDDLWTTDIPLVVRRDVPRRKGLIPVGVRGRTRAERCALWIDEKDIVKCLRPQDIVPMLLTSPFQGVPAVQSALNFISYVWPFVWGVTGSCAYSIVTGICAMKDTSDLDIIIRSETPLVRENFKIWKDLTECCPCRVDTQVDTGFGAFSLDEWIKGGTVLLKTDEGPVIVQNPWDLLKNDK